ncbi:licheninase [Mesorhizobium sp. B2-5-13]|nr:licheninase [Mesorhizobium sp. B2-5-13]TPK44467.1 licheninase [Mesorhizobium sp. B2-5-5]
MAGATVPSVRAADFAPVPYVSGTIKPNHRSQTELDKALVDFYRAWKSVYVVQDCGPGRYFVKVDADHKPVAGGTAAGTITVSEAHGYGMLITAMMAGADPHAQKIFDGMVLYFRDHPARSDANLLAWNQVAGCENAGDDVGGDNTATDGDLDIGYALLLADATWGSDGAIDYRAEADKVMTAILKHEVDPTSDFLLIGDWAGRGDDATYAATTRSSDFMMSHLAAFAQASGDPRWLSVRDRTYTIINAVRAGFSLRTGLMPDFIVGLPQSPAPAPSGFIEGESDGDYSWNAGRYPWRIGLDYLLNGDQRALNAVRPLNAWARRATGGVPQEFADTYRVDGSVPPGHGKNSMAFVSLLGVSAMAEPGNQRWLNAIWDTVTDKTVSDEDYFGNTLKLLAMISMSGHWARP